MSDSRTRNWSIIVYPDSAPENWQEIIDSNHIEWACSPLHDKDMNEDNTPKKPHYHVQLCFSGKKSFEQILEITKAVNGPIPFPTQDLKGAIQYFTHRNNPEKYQYDKSDIKVFGGFDLEAMFAPTKSERYKFIREMQNFVVETDIQEYSDLMDYARENNEDWFKLLCDNSSVAMKHYIDSRRYKYRDMEKQQS